MYHVDYTKCLHNITQHCTRINLYYVDYYLWPPMYSFINDILSQNCHLAAFSATLSPAEPDFFFLNVSVKIFHLFLTHSPVFMNLLLVISVHIDEIKLCHKTIQFVHCITYHQHLTKPLFH